MKRKKILCMVIAFACSTALTGCLDAMPDMTDEQQALVAEYAADMLLKYSKYYDDGLADFSVMQEVEDTVEEPELELEQPDEEDVISKEYELSDDEIEEKGEKVSISEASLTEVLDLDAFDISLKDFEITDAYPDDDNAAFFINAPQGKGMLVMKFDVKNITDSDAEYDISSIKPEFYISINGQKDKKAMQTPLLLDDFKTYKGMLKAGETISLVIVTETNPEMTVEAIESIDMSIELVEGRYVTKLY